MMDRRDILVGSATALAASLLTPSTPALAQATTVPGTKRGFLERPGCRIYYEVTGSGPPIIFAHGVGSNHQTWWQQVPHFFDRFTCVTFSHRGYPPSSEIGMPDPGEFAGDLASLIEHLQLPDVRLVAQSMGGWTAIEYILTHPQHNVRALVLASTCGTINRASVPLTDPQRLIEYDRKAGGSHRGYVTPRNFPARGRAHGKEQPRLHFLYREIANASAAFDRVELRKRIFAMANRSPDLLHGFMMPALFITGEEDIANFPPFIADALAPLMPNAKVEQVPEAGHSVYFQRADVFNRLVDNFLSKVG